MPFSDNTRPQVIKTLKRYSARAPYSNLSVSFYDTLYVYCDREGVYLPGLSPQVKQPFEAALKRAAEDKAAADEASAERLAGAVYASLHEALQQERVGQQSEFKAVGCGVDPRDQRYWNLVKFYEHGVKPSRNRMLVTEDVFPILERELGRAQGVYVLNPAFDEVYRANQVRMLFEDPKTTKIYVPVRQGARGNHWTLNTYTLVDGRITRHHYNPSGENNWCGDRVIKHALDDHFADRSPYQGVRDLRSKTEELALVGFRPTRHVNKRSPVARERKEVVPANPPLSKPAPKTVEEKVARALQVQSKITFLMSDAKQSAAAVAELKKYYSLSLNERRVYHASVKCALELASDIKLSDKRFTAFARKHNLLPEVKAESAVAPAKRCAVETREEGPQRRVAHPRRVY